MSNHDPNRFDDDYDDFECWNCDGEGYVWDCIDGFCVNAEDGCKLCTRRCEVCNPRLRQHPPSQRRTGHDDGG